MQDAVQDWIALCILSGGHDQNRWNEQAVFAFIWMLFVQPEQLWKLNVNWVHDKAAENVPKRCPEYP